MKRIKLSRAQRLVLLAVLWFFVGQPLFASLFFTRERYSYARVEPWREWNKPTEPRELEAYAFAHALKLPDSLPKPVPFDFSRYNRWNFMKFYLEYRWKTSFSDFLLLTVLLDFDESARIAYYRKIRLDYLDHLCETEAGEYIFKTVENVEGIYQMRTMPKRSDGVINDVYGFEDPADWSPIHGAGIHAAFLGNKWSDGFRFFETRLNPMQINSPTFMKKWADSFHVDTDSPYYRYSARVNPKFGGESLDKKVEPVRNLLSKYAYTWRGIRRDNDRFYGIAGGELIVLDRLTKEVLGVRRSFAMARPRKGRPFSMNWEFAAFCPENVEIMSSTPYADRVDMQKKVYSKTIYPIYFIRQVLHPVDFFNPELLRVPSQQGE